jgi:protein phosphatase
MFKIITESLTDIGDVKPSNQDSILCKTGVFGKQAAGLFIVADGCGGLSYGDEISILTITHFSRLWDAELKELFESKRATDNDISDLLEKAIKDINNSALEFGKQVALQVGTTLSLLLVIGNRYYIKNIGDSRVYIIRKGRLQQLTADQSLVASMLRNKELTPEEANSFGKKNVLTMCIGLFDDVKTYTKIGTVKSGDTFLLCCDGLYNCFPVELFNLLVTERHKAAPEALLQRLRNAIPPGGAKDNVSAVIASFKKKISLIKILIWLAVLALLVLSLLLMHDYITEWVDSQLGGGFL